MDLGLGLLEHKGQPAHERDSGSDDDGGDSAIDTLMGRSLKRGRRLIQQVQPEASPGSSAASAQYDRNIDLKLRHYLVECRPTTIAKMERILTLMTRIVRLLRQPHKKVSIITQLNVLRDDLYRLMRRRDTLLKDEAAADRHETHYFAELDDLLA